jgi:hypothetical protein
MYSLYAISATVIANLFVKIFTVTDNQTWN